MSTKMTEAYSGDGREEIKELIQIIDKIQKIIPPVIFYTSNCAHCMALISCLNKIQNLLREREKDLE